MVRVHVKGGIWKNTEDEILKAAVMKYGFYQWGRIASLMNRKTAKQCKARWYEWLDPSIKKTEWSREEDEKLLHAAKIMPCQWRSIATIVGRTASQCLERYRKLLDVATNQDSFEELPNFGQIEPDPESKPALPDAIDMEEDEKEMLQEARARMANTKGKKAKRIAREKQLEEARRLAVLQRKREMKAAGIDVGSGKRFRKYFGPDLNKEVPFFHAPLPGFHDASEELSRSEGPVDFHTVSQIASEPARRAEEEEHRRKLDQLKEQNKIFDDPLKALEQLQKEQMQRRANLRRQSKLKMPDAQITEQEIKQLSKMTFELDDEASALTAAPTDDLLSSYTVADVSFDSNVNQTPKPDSIMIEAANQAAIRAMPTALAGGEYPVLPESNFKIGAWREQLDTPNPLKTPLATGKTLSNKKARNYSATPVRDKLGLNTPQIDYYESQQELEAISRNRIAKLRAELTSLPAPKYKEFSVEFNADQAPEASTAIETQVQDTMLPDAEDLQLQMRIPERLQALKSLACRSSLVRPKLVSKHYFDSNDSPGCAEHLLRAQVMSLLECDNEVTESERNISNERALELIERYEGKVGNFTAEELSQAKLLLTAEVEAMLTDAGLTSETREQHYLQFWNSCYEQLRCVDHKVVKLSSLSESQKIQLARTESFELKNLNLQFQKKISSLEKKLEIYHGGYLNRRSVKLGKIKELSDRIWTLQLQLSALRRQALQEKNSIKQRIAQEKAIWDTVMRRNNRLYSIHSVAQNM